MISSPPRTCLVHSQGHRWKPSLASRIHKTRFFFLFLVLLFFTNGWLTFVRVHSSILMKNEGFSFTVIGRSIEEGQQRTFQKSNKPGRSSDDDDSSKVAISTIVEEKLSQVHSETSLTFQQYQSPPQKPHPLAGALDERQQWGYVQDEKSLTSLVLVPSVNVSKAACCCNYESSCHLSSSGQQVLRKVKSRLPNKSLASSNKTEQAKSRVLCAIYTYEGHSANIQAIAETWGGRCDGFVAASTYTDASIGTVHIPHFGTEGSYRSIWQKVRSLLAYVYMNFGQDYDAFHVCGDDTYLVVDNLKQFWDKEILPRDRKQPILAGGYIRPTWRKDLSSDFIYPGGGPGYTLNQAALHMFFQEGLIRCHPNLDQSYEDLLMGQCWEELIGVDRYWNHTLVPTWDDEKAARYHHYDPSRITKQNSIPFGRQQRSFRMKRWQEPRDELEAVSRTSISFHLVKDPSHMRQIDAFLYPDGNIGQVCESLQCGSRNNESKL